MQLVGETKDKEGYMKRKGRFPALKVKVGKVRTLYATPNRTQAVTARKRLITAGKSTIKSLKVKKAAGSKDHVLRGKTISIE